MNESKELPISGFALEKVYFPEQSLRTMPPSQELPESDPPVLFGWDWRLTGKGTFEVALHLGLGPTRSRPEEGSFAVCGAFRVLGNGVTVQLAEFVKAQGPAILFPYLRECIASLTGRGPFGALALPPVNVLGLMKDVDPEKATGAIQLRSKGESEVSEA